MEEIYKAIVRSSRRKTLLCFVSLSFVLVLFREQWLMLIGDFLLVQEPLHPADVIHVIAGDDYRTDYAIQLYKQGLGRTLFFTGGWCKIHLYHHGKHGEERSVSMGVPLSAIAYDEAKVLSTYMEAESLKEWIANSPQSIRSVMVVSDPFHMRRVRWTYQKVLGDGIELQMAPVPFDLTAYQQLWWKDQASRQNVREEYSKLLYYLLRYQYSWGFFKDWLASLDTE